MVSESKDGEFLGRLYRDLGGNSIRGSSSRRANEALRHASRELKRGGALVITPDGPRGPKHKLQNGIIHAARMSGKPIVPFSGSFGRSMRFERSWDQFEVPLPFGRFTFHCGKPLYVARDLDDHALEKVKAELSLRMRQITRRADAEPTKIYSMGRPRAAF